MKIIVSCIKITQQPVQFIIAKCSLQLYYANSVSVTFRKDLTSPCHAITEMYNNISEFLPCKLFTHIMQKNKSAFVFVQLIGI